MVGLNLPLEYFTLNSIGVIGLILIIRGPNSKIGLELFNGRVLAMGLMPYDVWGKAILLKS